MAKNNPKNKETRKSVSFGSLGEVKVTRLKIELPDVYAKYQSSNTYPCPGSVGTTYNSGGPSGGTFSDDGTSATLCMVTA